MYPKAVCAHVTAVPSAGPGRSRLASDKERAFLVAKGVFGVCVSRAGVVDIKTALSFLQHHNAPASTLAAVQGLQGAQPLTPAEISILSPASALQSGADEDDDEVDQQVPLAVRHDRYPAPPAVQPPDQAAQMHQQGAAAAVGAASPRAPETPAGTQQETAAGGAKRSSSEAFGACAEGLPGSKSLKAGGSSEAKERAAGLPRADPPRADLPPDDPPRAHTPRTNPPRRTQVAVTPAIPQTRHRSAEAVAEAGNDHGDAPPPPPHLHTRIG